METPPHTPGLINSIRALGDGLLGTVEDRLQLLAVEVQEEKFRLIQSFIWISAAVFTGMLAITFASLTLVYLFWDRYRLGILVGLTLLYAGAGVAIILRFRSYLAHQPKPFSSTLGEIQEDRACIRREN